MTIPQNLPGITYGELPMGYGPALPLPPKWIVIHDTGNTASAGDEAHYAAHRDDPRSGWTSAHFYVDGAQGGPVGSVPLDMQAWAAFANANGHAWHIEMCGQDAGEPGAVPPQTITHAAQLVARLAALAGIPVRKIGPTEIAAGESGICGHLDFTEEEHRAGGHTDPGYRFDWSAFIAAANNGGTPPPPPAPVGDNETEKIMQSLPLLRKDVAGGTQSVRNLQALLDAHDITDQDGAPLRVDGSFGPRTDYAVRTFQVKRHVANSVVTRDADGNPVPAHGDGQVGEHTWAALLDVA